MLRAEDSGPAGNGTTSGAVPGQVGLTLHAGWILECALCAAQVTGPACMSSAHHEDQLGHKRAPGAT